MKNLFTAILSFILIFVLITSSLSVSARQIYADNFSFDERTGRLYFDGISDKVISYIFGYETLDADKVKEIDFSYDYNVIIKGGCFMGTQIPYLYIPDNVKFEKVDDPTEGPSSMDTETTFGSNLYLEKVDIACSSIDNTYYFFLNVTV